MYLEVSVDNGLGMDVFQCQDKLSSIESHLVEERDWGEGESRGEDKEGRHGK